MSKLTKLTVTPNNRQWFIDEVLEGMPNIFMRDEAREKQSNDLLPVLVAKSKDGKTATLTYDEFSEAIGDKGSYSFETDKIEIALNILDYLMTCSYREDGSDSHHRYIRFYEITLDEIKVTFTEAFAKLIASNL